jgi:hypothetical protein
MHIIDLKKKKVRSELLLILILIVNFYIFAFFIDDLKANKTKVIDEINELNNLQNNLKSSGVSPLFDGMYLHHTITDYKLGCADSNISYSLLSADFFNVTWSFDGSPFYSWHVNSTSRELTDASLFTDYTHTPFWIFPNVSLGETVLISSLMDIDHTFEVSDELIYNLTGFGLLEVLVLQDLAYDNCSAWYNKGTGILLNGTFYYGGGYNYLIFDFIGTNVDFTYFTVINPVSASSWETETSQSINWTSTGYISLVKIELYKDDVFVMEIISNTTNDGEYSWEIPSTLIDSDQYQIKISDATNPSAYALSDYFEIFTLSEEIPLTLIITISAVGAAAIIGGTIIYGLRRRKTKA